MQRMALVTFIQSKDKNKPGLAREKWLEIAYPVLHAATFDPHGI